MPHTTLLILLCLSCVILSCNKKTNDLIHDRKQALPLMQESARIWYLQHREAKSNAAEHDMPTKYWAKASAIQTNDSNTILIVPMPDPHATARNKDITFKRFLVFQPSGNNITNGKVVELVGEKYNVKRHSDFLLKRISQNSIPGFNGSILQYDVNYNPLENARYENGVKRANTHTAVIKFAPLDKSRVRSGAGTLPLFSLTPGRYKIGNQTYTLKGMAPYKTLLIEDNDSLASDFIRHIASNNHSLKTPPFSQETLAHAFKNVLGEARIQQLSAFGKENMIVTLYCRQEEGKGKVAAVEYQILQPQESRITLMEIDKISDYLKEKIAFDLPSSLDNKGAIWPIAQAINFSRLAH